MIENKLTQLFTRYIKAFNHFNIEEMLQCCTIPCVLHTPDKIAYLSEQSLFIKEFEQIFKFLQEACVAKVRATQASYDEISPQLFIVSIDWEFLDANNEVYTDFSAFYHVSSQNDALKINNVISHELNNAVELARALNLNTIEYR